MSAPKKFRLFSLLASSFALTLLLLAHWPSARAQPAGQETANDSPNTGTSARLRQASQKPTEERALSAIQSPSLNPSTVTPAATVRYLPSEFERFVQSQSIGVEVRRFGTELLSGSFDLQGAELSPLVPQDYLVAVGDEVLLTLWGSVDADLRLQVDRSGRITVPRVGAVQVAGVRYGDLQAVVARRVAQVFRNFELNVSLGQLRALRVFVTGFVARPGAYSVNSLSSVVTALLYAGGPGPAGSFRNIELRRQGKLVSSFDLYELLLKGDRSADHVLQAGDVVHVGPSGIQVGIVGSINKPTVLELKTGETVADVLRVAGGFSPVADRTRLAIERLEERTAARVVQLSLPGALTQTLSHGDVLRVFSAVDVTLPTQRQSKRVRIEGEVVRPAEYVLPENSTLADLIRQAGGYTPEAYVFATEFTRASVQLTQQQNYERALRDMETELARSTTSQRISSSDEAAGVAGRSAANSQWLDRLRLLRPTGRIVLNLEPASSSLPDMMLEDGDRVFIPNRATTVGVFGSVFNAATYLYLPERKMADYLKLAGGPTKGADEGSIFLVRANGSVLSQRQRRSGWRNRDGELFNLTAEPGDSIFVPEELNKTTLVQNFKDWTQILSQFGLGLAAVRILGN